MYSTDYYNDDMYIIKKNNNNENDISVLDILIDGVKQWKWKKCSYFK